MKMIACLLLLLICGSYAQREADRGGLIDNLFTKAPSLPSLDSNVDEQITPSLSPKPPVDGSTLSSNGHNSGRCECVPYYQCNDSSIITNGLGLIDIRIKDGPCETYMDVCCNVPDQYATPPPPRIDKPKGCGVHNSQGIGFRITGNQDNESQFGEFPWMVAIFTEEDVEGNAEKLIIYKCGGSLIHPKVVLTAAHCVVDSKSKFKVRAGEWDTQTNKELYSHEDRLVEKIIHHPDYLNGVLYNDIALLFLDSPLPIRENIDVVCLPSQDAVIDDARCYSSGWGKDVFGKVERYQVILKKVELPMVPRHTCQESLRTTRLGKYFELHKSFVCAGGEEGKDTCKGDGGSPLVCPVLGHPGILQQVGIVAWGIGCGENRIPGIYANVAMFRDWIDEKLAYENIDITMYKY